MINGLTQQAEHVLLSISDKEFLKEFTFIGGSALAFQIHHRLSEDLDFCKWKTHAADRPSIDWPKIEKNIRHLEIVQKDLLGFDQVEFFLKNRVKLSFYANNQRFSPVTEYVPLKGFIKAAGKENIGVMKLELMLRRSSFRDYYDIYSILKEGANIKSLVYAASEYSGHTLKTKNILSFISDGDNYKKEKDFEKLEPKYAVNEKDIEKFIRQCIEKDFGRIHKK